jgi:hypothetical protein
MLDRPTAMCTNGRKPDPDFDEDECFYCRIDPAWVTNGKVDPTKVRCPDLSSNRSKYSEPYYVLYPRDKNGRHAVFRFRMRDVPAEIASQGTGGPPTLYGVRTVHDPIETPPEEDNYGHCETRVYRGQQQMKPNKLSPGARKSFQVQLSERMVLEREAGLPF